MGGLVRELLDRPVDREHWREQFIVGIDLIMDGIEARLQQQNGATAAGASASAVE